MVKIKKKLKRSLKEAEKAEPKIELPPPSRNSDEPIAKKVRPTWNKGEQYYFNRVWCFYLFYFKL